MRAGLHSFPPVTALNGDHWIAFGATSLGQASPTITVTRPEPPQSRQGLPSTLPVPEQRLQIFSADCLVPGSVSSPGAFFLAIAPAPVDKIEGVQIAIPVCGEPQAPPIGVITLPEPPQSGQGLPPTSPEPRQRRQIFSPAPGVPSGTASGLPACGPDLSFSGFNDSRARAICASSVLSACPLSSGNPSPVWAMLSSTGLSFAPVVIFRFPAMFLSMTA